MSGLVNIKSWENRHVCSGFWGKNVTELAWKGRKILSPEMKNLKRQINLKVEKYKNYIYRDHSITAAEQITLDNF